MIFAAVIGGMFVEISGIIVNLQGHRRRRCE